MFLTPTRVAWAVVAVASLLAVAGARPWAGGANDGSRLAAVESLVERGTLAIDASPWCDPKPEGIPHYDPSKGLWTGIGTVDKLRIDGHCYSDKPALFSLLMAATYRAGMALGLPAPSERPDVFCLALTIAFSGGAYLAALLCLWRVGRLAGLEGWTLTAWLASFAFATFALAYTRHVNNHILHLAAVAGICLVAAETGVHGGTWLRFLALGTLAGLAFNLDLGSGPLLVLACLALAALQGRSLSSVFLVGLAAAPWVAAGLGLNYALGGVLKPVNMVPEYLAWPGSPWNASNLTGFSRHSPLGLVTYSSSLMFGRCGLVPHNPALWLALPALATLWRAGPLRGEARVLLAWCGASWLLYTVLSNNHGGECCSIRWFVPFLAPGYLLLALHLRDSARSRRTMLFLSAIGAALGLLLWREGPWARIRLLELAPWLALSAAAFLVLPFLGQQAEDADGGALPFRGHRGASPQDGSADQKDKSLPFAA